MNAVSFDTLAVPRKLKAARFSEIQGEAITGVLQEAGRVDLSHLATKADLASSVTKTELKAELSDANYDILKWVLSTIGFQAIVIVGAIVTLSRGVR